MRNRKAETIHAKLDEKLNQWIEVEKGDNDYNDAEEMTRGAMHNRNRYIRVEPKRINVYQAVWIHAKLDKKLNQWIEVEKGDNDYNDAEEMTRGAMHNRNRYIRVGHVYQAVWIHAKLDKKLNQWIEVKEGDNDYNDAEEMKKGVIYNRNSRLRKKAKQDQPSSKESISGNNDVLCIEKENFKKGSARVLKPRSKKRVSHKEVSSDSSYKEVSSSSSEESSEKNKKTRKRKCSPEQEQSMKQPRPMRQMRETHGEALAEGLKGTRQQSLSSSGSNQEQGSVSPYSFFSTSTISPEEIDNMVSSKGMAPSVQEEFDSWINKLDQ
jgi:hypothetical protein